MARIVGVDIPSEKVVVVSITYIYGIGLATAQKIVEAAKIDPLKRVKDLSEDEIARLRQEIAHYKVEGDLRREVMLNIKRLQEIGCYRGIRHRRGLQEVFQLEVKEQKLTLVHAKVHVRQLLIRKKLLSSRR